MYRVQDIKDGYYVEAETPLAGVRELWGPNATMIRVNRDHYWVSVAGQYRGTVKVTGVRSAEAGFFNYPR